MIDGTEISIQADINPPYMHETVQSPTRSHRLWHLRGSTQFKKKKKKKKKKNTHKSPK